LFIISLDRLTKVRLNFCSPIYLSRAFILSFCLPNHLAYPKANQRTGVTILLKYGKKLPAVRGIYSQPKGLYEERYSDDEREEELYEERDLDEEVGRDLNEEVGEEEERDLDEEIIIDKPFSHEQMPRTAGDFSPYFSNITEALIFCWMQKHSICMFTSFDHLNNNLAHIILFFTSYASI
jgi:hypothetical protein